MPIHAHSWRLMEMEYGRAGEVRRFECSCGEIDFEAPVRTAV